MKLSAPIHILKQQAKSLSRKDNIPLHQALDQIAKREGYSAWSLLSAKATSDEHAPALLARLHPGELILLGARPGQGKTLLSLELAILAMKQGRQAAFFTLDFTQGDVADRFQVLGENLGEFTDRFLVDDSDHICADFIITKLESAPQSTLVIIDYLQLLDQNRANPSLMDQVHQLKRFARSRHLIILCLSQIHRSYDSAKRAYPDISDIRLPNPLDLGLFDRTCFLNQGEMRVA